MVSGLEYILYVVFTISLNLDRLYRDESLCVYRSKVINVVMEIGGV